MTMSPAKMNFPWSLREIIKFIHLKRKNFFFFENEKKNTQKDKKIFQRRILIKDIKYPARYFCLTRRR